MNESVVCLRLACKPDSLYLGNLRRTFRGSTHVHGCVREYDGLRIRAHSYGDEMCAAFWESTNSFHGSCMAAIAIFAACESNPIYLATMHCTQALAAMDILLAFESDNIYLATNYALYLGSLLRTFMYQLTHMAAIEILVSYESEHKQFAIAMYLGYLQRLIWRQTMH